MRKLPTWLANGPEVSELAYEICVDGAETLRGPSLDMTPMAIAERHGVDEADVLRALAELARKGVFEDPPATRGTEAHV